MKSINIKIPVKPLDNGDLEQIAQAIAYWSDVALPTVNYKRRCVTLKLEPGGVVTINAAVICEGLARLATLAVLDTMYVERDLDKRTKTPYGIGLACGKPGHFLDGDRDISSMDIICQMGLFDSLIFG